jgi:signal transduction histidine kinase
MQIGGVDAMKGIIVALAVSPLLVFCAAQPLSAQGVEANPQYDQPKRVIAFVEKAAALVEREGEKAFAEFRKKGSEWFEGNVYIFVNDLEGTVLCLPPMPKLEGTNIIDRRDPSGKPVVAMMIEKVTGDKAVGWVHYQWLKPGGDKPFWKSSHVARVEDIAGKEYIVGSGLYDKKVEKLFVVETVDEAAKLIKEEGKRAFQTLRDKSGPFRYQDVHLFVYDQNGMELVNPVSPNLEGRNLLDFKDTNGKMVVRDTIKMLEAKETGWIDYMWPKPGETEPSKKLSYVRKVKMGDEVLYVGAGIYLD